MKLKHFLQLIILFFCICCYGNICRAESFSAAEAENWTANKGKQIIELLASPDNNAKIKQLDTILFNDVDLDYAARFVMGKYYKQMTDAQKNTYIPLFKRYTSALYKKYPLQIEQGSVTYSIDKVISAKNAQFVHCTVYIAALENNLDENSRGGIKVVFRLVKNNGKIQVRDLQIMESSLLQAYRSRFYKMLHEDDDDDIDWFLEDLAQLVKDLENPQPE